jgi:branched-chain amino acid transport system ATP-binding protein
MNQPLLAVNGLHVRYGSVPAVRGVSLEIAAGEIICILGPNGAGKSTLLRAISGLVAAWSGEVRFSGAALDRRNPWSAASNGVAHVPQGRRCFANLTVEENLILGAYQCESKQLSSRLRVTYETFPILRDKRRQMAGQLSGGQQQTLAIARALMSEPKVLMLDEPSLGLAPLVVRSLAPVLQQQAKANGMAILLAEQTTTLASICAPRGYVMHGGLFTLEGPTHEIGERLIAEYFGSDDGSGINSVASGVIRDPAGASIEAKPTRSVGGAT